MSIGDIDKEIEYEQGAQEKEVDKVSRSFAALATSPAWQEVDEYLRAMTVDRPTFPAGVIDGSMASMIQNHREGENNLYRRIKALIKHGQEIENGLGQ